MHCPRVLNLLATASLLVPSVSQAQAIRGHLLDAYNDMAIERAFIVLLGDGGEELARALTDSRGVFYLRTPGPGLYGLKSERIGFQSTTLDSVRVTGAEITEVELAVPPVVVRLDEIVVRGEAKKCRVFGEQALETVTVWEEARKALAGAAWAEAEGDLTFEIVKYQRFYDENMRQHYEERAPTRRLERVMPFATLRRELRQYGYVIETDDSTIYHLPDPSVFFSEDFLVEHCFKLEEGNKEAEGLIGLVFEPVKGVDRPDIEGTMWLEPESAELRWMDLRYTNLRSRLRERHARARIEFASTPGGVWFVSSWWTRGPFIEVERAEIGGPTRDRQIITAYEQTGGEVLQVVGGTGEVLFPAEPGG